MNDEEARGKKEKSRTSEKNEEMKVARRKEEKNLTLNLQSRFNYATTVT